MQMTIKQLMNCAEELRSQAYTTSRIANTYRKELNELKDPYEDVAIMPEKLKERANCLEERIHENQEKETAYTLLADAIEEKEVVISFFGVAL